MTKTAEVTVPMEPALRKQIEQELEYGDTLAGWMRGAARKQLRDDCTATAD